MIRIENLTGINLGVQGENLSKTIEIDMSSWLAAWPDATICVMHKRWSEEIPYTVGTASVERPEGGSLELDGNTLLWHISADDTAVAGRGAVQIIARQNGVIAKSIVVPALVVASISDVDGPEPEPPEQMWLDRLEGIAQSAEDSVAQAQETLRDARRLLNEIYPDNIVYFGDLAPEDGPEDIGPGEVPPDNLAGPRVSIPCTALRLSHYDYIGPVGTEFMLTAYVQPTNATDSVSFIASVPGMVELETAGMGHAAVTMTGTGHTVITVRCGSKVAFCDVTVTDDVLEDDPDEPGKSDINPGDVPADDVTEPVGDIPCVAMSMASREYTGPVGTVYRPQVYLIPGNTTDAVTFRLISGEGVVSVIPLTGEMRLIRSGEAFVQVRCGSVVDTIKIVVVDDILEDDPDEAGPEDIEAPPEE